MTEVSDPSPGHRALVDWIRANPRYLNPVADRALTSFMANAIENWKAFTRDKTESINLDARDLLYLRAAWREEIDADDVLMKVAFTRAVIDDDGEALEIINRLGVSENSRYWADWLKRCRKEEVADHLRSLEQNGPEEALWVGRLIAARRFPDLMVDDWLFLCPERHPRVTYYLAEIALRAERASDLIADCLRKRADVLLSVDPDRLLGQLVAHSKTPPAATLKGFEAYKSEALTVAVAKWHFDHGEFAKVVELTRNFRYMSRQADDAYLLCGLSSIELDKPDEAAKYLEKISTPSHLANLTVAIAEKSPALVDKDRLIAFAHDCGEGQEEVFFKLLLCLLKRNCLAEARKLCEDKPALRKHPALGPIMAQILPATQTNPG